MRAPALAACAAIATTSATAAPVVDLGDRDTTGARIDAVAACGSDRAITLDDGGWLDAWNTTTGARGAALGGAHRDILSAIACDGDLVVDARGSDVVLWRGSAMVARAPTSGALGAAVVAGHGYFADEHGVYQLPADGWKPWPTEGIGLHAVVRADLVVSGDGTTLDWRRRGSAQHVELPGQISAIADVGDAIAVADHDGDVFLLTEPKLGRPVLVVTGEPTAIAGDRAWLAIGLRDGSLVQARRAPAMTALPAVQVVRQSMYEAVNDIAASGERWLVGGDDQRLHRVPRGATTYRAPELAGHADSPWAVALDDAWIVSGSSDETVRIAAIDGTPVAVLHPSSDTGTRPILAVGLTPQLVWARDDYNNLYRWARKGLQPLPVIASVAAAAPLDAGTLTVVTKRHLATLDLRSGAIHALGKQLDVQDAVLAVGGGVAALGDDISDKPTAVLDARTAAVIAAIPAVTGVNRHALAVCPDGGTVIYADDQTVHAWSRAKRAVVATVELASPVSALACSATGRVAVGLWDGTISVRALDGLRPLTELADHHGWVYALAWSGRRLASTGGDFRVQVAEP